MKVSISIFVLLLITFSSLIGQSTVLNSGNEVFSKPLNIKTEYPKIESIVIPHKKKKIIIDFFSSYCVVCFREIPKLDSIQNKFNDDLKVFLIGKDDPKIRRIYNKLREKHSINLSVAYDSTIFNRLSIKEVPRYYWINENGKVINITGPDDVTVSNIEKFLKNESINLEIKTKNQKYDLEKLLYQDENLKNIGLIKVKSILSDWDPDLEFHLPPKIENLISKKFQAIGCTLSNLYLYAYFGISSWRIDHPFYTKVFPYPVVILNDGTAKKHSESRKRFCYSVFKSDGLLKKTAIQLAIKKDLEIYLGNRSRLTEIKVPCWELITKEGKSVKKSRGISAKSIVDPLGFSIKNKPIDEIIKIIYRYNKELPIIDRTGITYNVDIKIIAFMENMTDISKELSKHGLELKKSSSLMTTILLE